MDQSRVLQTVGSSFCYTVITSKQAALKQSKHWLKTTLPCVSGIKEANKTKTKYKDTTSISKTARENLAKQLKNVTFQREVMKRPVQLWKLWWAKLYTCMCESLLTCRLAKLPPPEILKPHINEFLWTVVGGSIIYFFICKVNNAMMLTYCYDIVSTLNMKVVLLLNWRCHHET